LVGFGAGHPNTANENSVQMSAPSSSTLAMNDEEKKRNERDMAVWQCVARGLDTIRGMEYTK
jgi:hypothetical protein